MKLKNLIIVFSLWSLAFSLIGCDAFVRKFTRKPKKNKIARVRPVFIPQEYRPDMTQEELYRQYFLFWKGWHDELVESLIEGASYKKQGNCAEQAIENLYQLRTILLPEKQQELDIYIGQLKGLQVMLKNDAYGSGRASNRLTAERIKMRILKDFSYGKVKEYLR